MFLSPRKRAQGWNTSTRSYEVEQILTLVVVHNFPLYFMAWGHGRHIKQQLLTENRPGLPPHSLQLGTTMEKEGHSKTLCWTNVIPQVWHHVWERIEGRTLTPQHILKLHMQTDGCVVSRNSGEQPGKNSWRQQWII